MPRLILIGLLAAAAAGAQTFLAGAAKADVSPRNLPAIANCFMLERTVGNVTRPLFARAIVLSDGQMKIAIAVVDSCMMPRELLDKAKDIVNRQTGIPVNRILISATHTHSAPAAMPCLGSDAQQDYAAALPSMIAGAIQAANRNLEPAEAGWAVEDDWEHTHCRRWIYYAGKMLTDPFGQRSVRANMHPGYQNPDAIAESGPVDPALSVLSIRGTAGKPLALLANYSQHYFGDAPFSPDYYGLFADKITEQTGAIAIMSQGTSGDQMWMDYGKPKSSITLEQYASEVSATALRAYQRIRYERTIPLAMAETRLRLGRRLPDAARLAWARSLVKEMNGRKPKNQPEVYAREQLFLVNEPERDIILQAIRIGGLNIHAIPNEVFAITGLKLKLQSPFETVMNIELANGAEGYIPPPEQHRLGGYTTWPARSAGLTVEAEPRITEALLRMSEELAGKPKRMYHEPRGEYVREILQSKPSAYWRFSEFGGPKAFDLIANKEAAYEGGIAFFLPGPSSLAFSGTALNRAVHLAGGRIAVPAGDLRGDSSVELWFWSALHGDLFSFGNLQVAIREDGRLRAGSLTGQNPVAFKKWHHLVLVRRGPRVQLYLDGGAETSGPVPPPQSSQIVIGGLEGKVDELALYRRALTAVEVSNHFTTAR